MTITYPTFWRGGRWNIESLIRDLFTLGTNKSALDPDELRVERFFTVQSDREAWIKEGNAYLLVHRRGGRYNNTTLPDTDESICDLVALTADADESAKLNEYITDVLISFEDGGTVHRSAPHLSGLSTTFMTVPGEVVGPQLIPELTRDERFVPATWQIHAARPHGLPNYRELLELDSE